MLQLLLLVLLKGEGVLRREGGLAACCSPEQDPQDKAREFRIERSSAVQQL